MIQIELGILITLLLSFFGFLIGAGKVLLAQVDRRQNERDKKQEDQIRALLMQMEKEADSLVRFERDFLRFQADLPVHYVRREDYIRGQSVIEAKLDALYSKIETLQTRGTHD